MCDDFKLVMNNSNVREKSFARRDPSSTQPGDWGLTICDARVAFLICRIPSGVMLRVLRVAPPPRYPSKLPPQLQELQGWRAAHPHHKRASACFVYMYMYVPIYVSMYIMMYACMHNKPIITIKKQGERWFSELHVCMVSHNVLNYVEDFDVFQTDYLPPDYVPESLVSSLKSIDVDGLLKRACQLGEDASL